MNVIKSKLIKAKRKKKTYFKLLAINLQDNDKSLTSAVGYEHLGHG